VVSVPRLFRRWLAEPSCAVVSTRSTRSRTAKACSFCRTSATLRARTTWRLQRRSSPTGARAFLRRTVKSMSAPLSRLPCRYVQAVNNPRPSTRRQQGLSGISGNVVINQRTTFSRILCTQRVPVRATDTKNPRVQAPALAYEPGGRRFESCRARHFASRSGCSLLALGHCAARLRLVAQSSSPAGRAKSTTYSHQFSSRRSCEQFLSQQL
jgi:hypothetical protein